MLLFILADDLLTDLGRIAALVLVIYVFLFAMLFFVASLLLLYSNAWLRDKIGLIHQLRSIIESIDKVIHSPSSETLPATLEPDNRLGQAIQALHMVQSAHIEQIARNTQRQVNTIEKNVEPVADRIAGEVIEFRARTIMAQSILKAFFLPGLIKQKPRSPLLLTEAIDNHSSVQTEVSVGGSSLSGVSTNVVVTQVNPSGDGVHQIAMRGPVQLESEGAERTDDAPGH